jgi:hypothetical protein
MKATPEDNLIEQCLASIQAMSPAVAVHLARPTVRRRTHVPEDGELLVRMAHQHAKHRFLVQVKRTHLSYAVVDCLLGKLSEVESPWA